MSMLRLYRSLIRFKVDYGSFVYGSTTESTFSNINPIHNTGIRLATGAYRTSRLESLYAESGEPPLNLRRNLLLCVYVLKLTNSAPLPLTWCNFPFRTPQQVRIEHNSLPTCGCLLPPASASTWYLLAAHHSLQALLGNYPLDLCPPTRQTRERRNIFPHLPPVLRWTNIRLPGPHGGVHWRVVCSWIDRQWLHIWWPGISYRLHNFNSLFTAELYANTELFCSSGVNLSNAISFAQTPRMPCRVRIAVPLTIPSS
jgi:hypothetical protein